MNQNGHSLPERRCIGSQTTSAIDTFGQAQGTLHLFCIEFLLSILSLLNFVFVIPVGFLAFLGPSSLSQPLHKSIESKKSRIDVEFIAHTARAPVDALALAKPVEMLLAHTAGVVVQAAGAARNVRRGRRGTDCRCGWGDCWCDCRCVLMRGTARARPRGGWRRIWIPLREACEKTSLIYPLKCRVGLSSAIAAKYVFGEAKYRLNL